MSTKDDEEQLIRSVVQQNALSIHLARRKAEEALRKQSDWLRVTLSSIGDAVITTDVEARVTFMNRVAESLTGWTQAEVMGRPLTDIFQILNEQSRQPVENPALRTLGAGAIVGLANHTLLIAKDGVERPIDDTAAPIRNEQGEVVGVVLVFRDISERKRLELEREQLLATAGHHIDKLAREGLPWMKAITTVRRACLHAVRGDTDKAVDEFRAAVTACDATELGAYAAASRIRLGTLLGGDEGRTLREDGLARLTAEEIKQPESFVALYAP